ncbi:MAG TPA: single-stranded-DNA-specific exonuclease RecJ [Bryobacteraceae bacterium]|nr:single-stranded-DNA-specific exonuclease RecJ [Bryobacteraceae bacterium]
MTQAHWRFPLAPPDQARELASALGIRLPAARVLAARGYTDPAAARRFLNPSTQDLNDPFAMAGMREALTRLQQAIARQDKILLYGDYDVDGTTSVAVLKKAIDLAGGIAEYHIPHRIRDGYGMRTEAIDDAIAAGIGLVISVDTGIRAGATVRYAAERGLDVIVTDHHVPDADIPPACAVVNPKQPGCTYPDKNLCGAGIAFKLVQALLGTLGWPEAKLARMLESFLRPVAIATVADVVPLTGENRLFVKFGLEGLRNAKNPGLRALMSVAGIKPNEAPNAGQVAFRIAPRLNAAGRMDDASEVVDLLLTADADEARRIAEKLDRLNRERQGAEEEITRTILAACLDTPVTESDYGLVFSGAGWHRGVVGIVASRLVERFHRPVVVLAEDEAEGLAQGSGRSIAGFDLLSALEAMPELFVRFGGHRQAAGLTLVSDRVPEFRARFNAYAASHLTPADLEPQLDLDAPAELEELDDQAVSEILSLAPFGFGNPAPVFGLSGVELAAEPVVIKEKHLRLTVRQNGRTLTIKAWNFAERMAGIAPGTRLDAAVAFEHDDYSASRGYSPWCAVLRDFRVAEAAAATA